MSLEHVGGPFDERLPALLRQHATTLRQESGITDAVISERGYRSVLHERELADLNFSPAQCRPPGLLLPVWTPDGRNPLHAYRPDHPRHDARGHPLKYEIPRGASVRLDVPPRCQGVLGNPAVPLWITEGIKKADALASHSLCALALLGVWNFRGRNSVGGVVLLADLDHVALNARCVTIVFDSDVSMKLQVRAAMDRLAEHLKRRGATIRTIYFPSGGRDNGRAS